MPTINDPFKQPASGIVDPFKAAPASASSESAAVRLADFGRQVAGGAVSAAGYGLRGISEAAALPGAVSGTPATRMIARGAQAITDSGNAITDGVSLTAAQRLAGSQPTGEFLRPSTWSLGTDPTVSGYALQAANVLGQAIPLLATGAITRGKMAPTAAVGATVGGGAAAEEEGGAIKEMALHNLQKLPGYNQRIASGMTPEEAQADLAGGAARGAFLAAAPVGAADAFTQILPFRAGAQRALGNVVGDSRIRRGAAGLVLGGLGEGVQEVAEGVAARTGADMVTGDPRNVFEDTFGEFALGALGGGPIGAVAGLATPNRSAAERLADTGAPVMQPEQPAQAQPDQQQPEPVPVQTQTTIVDPADGPLSRAAATDAATQSGAPTVEPVQVTTQLADQNQLDDAAKAAGKATNNPKETGSDTQSDTGSVSQQPAAPPVPAGIDPETGEDLRPRGTREQIEAELAARSNSIIDVTVMRGIAAKLNVKVGAVARAKQAMRKAEREQPQTPAATAAPTEEASNAQIQEADRSADAVGRADAGTEQRASTPVPAVEDTGTQGAREEGSAQQAPAAGEGRGVEVVRESDARAEESADRQEQPPAAGRDGLPVTPPALVYDETPEALDGDITTPSGTSFSIRGAADNAARGVPDARVIPLDDGTFAVRTPTEQTPNANTPVQTPSNSATDGVAGKLLVQPGNAADAGAPNAARVPAPAAAEPAAAQSGVAPAPDGGEPALARESESGVASGPEPQTASVLPAQQQPAPVTGDAAADPEGVARAQDAQGSDGESGVRGAAGRNADGAGRAQAAAVSSGVVSRADALKELRDAGMSLVAAAAAYRGMDKTLNGANLAPGRVSRAALDAAKKVERHKNADDTQTGRGAYTRGKLAGKEYRDALQSGLRADTDAGLKVGAIVKKLGEAERESIRQQYPAESIAASVRSWQANNPAAAPAAPAPDPAVDAPGTHKDAPGETAEPATPAVAAKSLRTAAENTEKSLKAAREQLLAQIDAAIEAAAIEGKPFGQLSTTSVNKASEQRKEREAEAKAAGHVTFDVPGDGRFRIVNTKARLREFRANIEKSAGFRAKQAQPRGPQQPSLNPSDAERARIMAEAETVDAQAVKTEAATARDVSPDLEATPTPSIPTAEQSVARAIRKIAGEVETQGTRGGRRPLDTKWAEAAIKRSVESNRLMVGKVNGAIASAKIAVAKAKTPADLRKAADKLDPPAAAPSPTGPVEAAVETVVPTENSIDAGDELAYNRRNLTGKNLTWDDIADQNATLRAKQTVKTKIWPRPDYEKLVQDGMHPLTARLVKDVYDALAAKPKRTDDASLQAYIAGMGKVRDAVMAWAPTVDMDGVTKALAGAQDMIGFSRAREAIDGALKTAELREAIFPSGGDPRTRYRGGPNSVANNALFNTVSNARRLNDALSPGPTALRDAMKAVREGWPAPQEAWEKSYTIHATPAGTRIVERGEARTTTTDEYFITQKGRRSIVGGPFTSRDAAVIGARDLAAGRRKKGGNMAEEAIELRKAVRDGAPRRAPSENVTSERVMETFGIRGVNFGNWMKGEGRALNEERQLHLNHIYDALTDLSEVMNIPAKAIGLDGMLGIAVGAQGSGGKGAGAAHFIPGVNEINITRRTGVGALAHEWGHALDHYFAVQAGEQVARSRTPFLTEHTQAGDRLQGIRPEIAQAFRSIVDAMNRRPETDAERATREKVRDTRDTKRLDSWLTHIAKSIERVPEAQRDVVRTEAEQLFDRLRAGDMGEGYVNLGKSRNRLVHPVVEQLRVLFKQNGVTISPDDLQSVEANANMIRIGNETARGEREPRGPMTRPTDFVENAKALDAAQGGQAYWNTNLELFARAFQSYVLDRLAERGIRSDYLTRPQGSPERIAKLVELKMIAGDRYPRGVEREAMNAAFDTLVGEIRTRTGDDGRVGLFSRPDGPPQRLPIPALTKQQMLDRGADGHLTRGYERFIPIEKLDGLEPVPANNESDDGAYRAGRPVTQPIEVQYDAETDSYMVYGGNHRIAQARANGQTHILAFVETARGKGAPDTALRENPDAGTGRLSVRPETDQTQTPAFRRWFGDSKVVDANGAPLVVYHGTTADFTEFNPASSSRTGHPASALGVYFTASPRIADRFSRDMRNATDFTDPARQPFANGANTVPAYMAIKNPKIYSDAEFRALFVDENYRVRDAAGFKAMRAELIEQGHDGIIVEKSPSAVPSPGLEEYGARQFIAFNATQIKSATANSGAFDPANPSILASRAEPGRPAADANYMVPPDQLRSHITKIVGKWKGDIPLIRVVDSASELPAFARREQGWQQAEGFYDGTGTVYLVATNIANLTRAEQVLAHEAFGHYGVEGVVGKAQWTKIVGDVARLRKNPSALKGDMQAAMASAERRYGGQNSAVFAREFLAVMAERGVRSSLLGRVLSAVRGWLRSMGFDVARWADASLRETVAKGMRQVRERGAQRADSGRGGAMSAANPTFYSAMTEAVAEAKGAPRKASAEQWGQWLDGAARRGEFKQEERIWSGVDDWMRGQTNITREQLLDYVRANEVQIEETVLGADPLPPLPEGWRTEGSPHWEPTEWTVFNEDGEPVGDGATERAAMIDAMDPDALTDMPEAASMPKFSNYTLPGGQNYRELLLTLPPPSTLPDGYTVGPNPSRASNAAPYIVSGADGQRYGSGQTEADAVAAFHKHHGAQFGSPQYQSSHYDQPNILAHVRFNERTDASGARVLFLEEVQSDWHQDGRRSGYAGKNEVDTTGWSVQGRGENRLVTHANGQPLRSFTGDSRPDAELIAQAAQEMGTQSGVPDAPFKTTWPMLAMKRMIRYAVDNGFDRIAWTTGSQQEARYWGDSLSDPAVQRWNEISKPQGAREQLLHHFGGELASVAPLEIVDAAMLGALQNDQVRRAVVEAIPVDVVNVLSDNGVTPDQLLGQNNVVGAGLPVDARAAVAAGLARATQLVGARLRTALDGVLASDAARGDVEILPAVRASDLDAGVVMRLLTTPSRIGSDGSGADATGSGARSGAEPALRSGGLAREDGKLTPAMVADALNRHAAIVSERTGNAIKEVKVPPGEGMRAFYDKMLPAEVNKLAKRYGARVGDTTITTQGTETAPAHSLDITDGMRTVAREGLPMFSRPDTLFQTIGTAMRDGDDGVMARLKGKVEDFKPALLGALTLRQLAEVSERYLPSGRQYVDTQTEMSARRNLLQQEVGDLSQQWEAMQARDRRKATAEQKKNRDTDSDRTTDVMHDATIAGTDPAEAYKVSFLRLNYNGDAVPLDATSGAAAIERIESQLADREFVKHAAYAVLNTMRGDVKRIRAGMETEAERAAAHPKLVRQFNRLPAEWQQLYRDVRDSYAKRADQMLDALLSRIEALEIDKKQKAALTTRMRTNFESARVEAPYFPLARFGDFWASLEQVDADGNTERQFVMGETQRERDRAIRAAEAAGWKVASKGKKIENVRSQDGTSGTFVSDVIESLKGNGVGEVALDEIYQLYLRTLPDLSTRKHFIHRKKIAGYDQDALRAFSGQMFYGAHQLSKVEFQPRLENDINAIVKEAQALQNAADPDADRASAAVNEFKKRHEWVLNPTNAKWAQQLSSLNFVFYLGLTPAAAFVNLSQTAITTYPVLASRYGAMKALTMTTDAIRQAGTRAIKDTVGALAAFKDGKVYDQEKTLGMVARTPDERRAYADLLAMGAIDVTQSHDLAGLGDTDTRDYNPTVHRAMNVISYLFHKAEVINREASGLANYRLAREAGKSHEVAVKEASETIWLTHFDYCVDTETEALTTRGWLRHDEIRIGDTIIGIDEAGRATETLVREVNVFAGKKQVIEFGSSRRFSMALTPEHEAVIQTYDSKTGNWSATKKVQARDLRNSHHVMRAPLAPIDRRDGRFGTDFAALLGWIAAEGWYAKFRNCDHKSDVRVSQSISHNPDHVETIRGILSRIGTVYSEQKPAANGTITWTIGGDLRKQILAAMPDKLLTFDLFAQMTAEEMAAVLDAFAKGDGSARQNGAYTIDQAPHNTQNLQVLQAMATALGRTATIDRSGRQMVLAPTIGKITQRSIVKSMTRREIEVDTVWCPTTDSGTWIARRHGAVFVTGNSNANRARFMQGNTAKVLLAFRQYSQSMTFFLWRSFYLSMKGETPEVKREARNRLVGALGMTGVFAGVMGMPLMSMMFGIANLAHAAFGDDDEPWDAEVEFRNFLVDMFGQKLGRVIDEGLVEGGLAAVGISPPEIGSRVALDQLWIRRPDPDLEGKDLYMHLLEQAAGPVAGIAGGAVTGAGMIAEGLDVGNPDMAWRGIEKMMPKVLRDSMKALRYQVQGVTNMRGDPLVADTGVMESIYQGMGFMPADVSRQYEINAASKLYEGRINERKQRLLTAYALAIKEGDTEAAREVIQKITSFNKAHPAIAINANTIRRSLQSRQRYNERSVNGIVIGQKLQGEVSDRVRFGRDDAE